MCWHEYYEQTGLLRNTKAWLVTGTTYSKGVVGRSCNYELYSFCGIHSVVAYQIETETAAKLIKFYYFR